MDIATVTGAYQGLKTAKDLITTLFEAKVEAEAKPKIIEALNKVGEAQETLFVLRDELFRLQAENNELRRKAEESDLWRTKTEQYELVKTVGGAVVYRFKGEPEHFSCPSCFNLKQIHILQDNRTISGKYRCTGCNEEYPIEPRKPINVRPTTNYW